MGNEKEELQQKYETAQAFFDKKDYKNAFNLFIKLAKKGDRKSQYSIAYFYIY
jgi:TPR repeat protein